MTRDNIGRMYYLLVHTMTIADYSYVVRAQFFHVVPNDLSDVGNATLINRRFRIFLPTNDRHKRSGKRLVERLSAPDLRTLMKKNSTSIKHHVRTFHINRPQVQATPVLSNHRVVSKSSPVHVSVELSPNPTSPQSVNEAVRDVTVDKQRDQMLAEDSTPQQTEAWLIMNRFEKFVSTFANFSGADMLRLSREDLIQICGHADGIRLFNALHSKTLAPLLKIYVCREGSSVFNAIFLTSYNYMELLGKLALMVGLSKEQIFDIYIEGPQSIRVQMTNDVLRHIKEETMFSMEILQENGKCVFLLKSAK